MAEGKDKGWISLYRSIQDSWLWEDAEKLKAWIDLLLLANHQDRKFLLGNELMEVKRGCYHTSELKLMERWQWSKKRVRNFLELLEKDGMIILEKSKKGTTIKLVNYNIYQGLGNHEGTTKEPQGNHEGTIEEPQGDHKGYTNNNYNKENNYNNSNKENKGIRKETPQPPSIPSNLSNIEKIIFESFGEIAYSTWFANCKIEEQDKLIRFKAPSEFKRDMITRNYKETLELLSHKEIVIEVGD